MASSRSVTASAALAEGSRSSIVSTPSMAPMTAPSTGTRTVSLAARYEARLSPTNRSRRTIGTSVTIWRRPNVRPKKKPAKAVQNAIITAADGSGSTASNAPGLNRTANIAITRAGDPKVMARVSRFRRSSSRLRRVSTAHWRSAPVPA
jgi:hypothetical protein